LLTAKMPFFDTDLMMVLADVNRGLGKNWDVVRLKEELRSLGRSMQIKIKETPFATQYEKVKD
jgi:hypothetical protein